VVLSTRGLGYDLLCFDKRDIEARSKRLLIVHEIFACIRVVIGGLNYSINYDCGIYQF
jgi:hypothetical protein